MTHEIQHLHKRKVVYLKPHENTPIKQSFDKVAYVVAFVGPIASVDQLLQIWNRQSAEGVSIIFWLVTLSMSGFWFTYGMLHKEKAIIISHTLWMFLSSLILLGIVVF